MLPQYHIYSSLQYTSGEEDDTTTTTTTTTTTNKPQMIESTEGTVQRALLVTLIQPGTTEEIETDPIDDLFSWLMATPPPANGKFKNGRTFSGYVFCILSSFSRIRIKLINYLHSQPPGTLSITCLLSLSIWSTLSLNST